MYMRVARFWFLLVWVYTIFFLKNLVEYIGLISTLIFHYHTRFMYSFCAKCIPNDSFCFVFLSNAARADDPNLSDLHIL